MLDRHEIAIHYDGRALSGHLIDVEDLAPSLIGLQKALDIITKQAMPGKRVAARLQINACLRPGGAIADLVFSVDIPTTAFVASVLTPSISISARGIWDAFWEVLRAKRFLKGGEGKMIVNKDGTTVIVDGNNNQITINSLAGDVIRDEAIDRPVERFLSPLRRGQVESLELPEREGKEMKITPAVAAEICAPLPQEGSLSLLEHVWVTATVVSFDPSDSWKVKDEESGNTYIVKITDKDFLEAMAGRVYPFILGTRMLVNIELLQRTRSGRRVTETTIVKVFQVAEPSDPALDEGM